MRVNDIYNHVQNTYRFLCHVTRVALRSNIIKGKASSHQVNSIRLQLGKPTGFFLMLLIVPKSTV